MTQGPPGLKFEPISRSDAKLLLEIRLRMLRRTGQGEEYKKLQEVHRNTFL